jgi:hypothetical protein
LGCLHYSFGLLSASTIISSDHDFTFTPQQSTINSLAFMPL